MRGVLEALAADLRSRGGFDLEEAFIDGSFAPAKKGGAGVGKTKRGKGTKIMALQTAMVFQSRFAQKAPRHMK